MEEMAVPLGYCAVEHADGTIHAINLSEGTETIGPLWRQTPVCDTATGVSSDEGGPAALHRRAITCIHCMGILRGE
jgi:hypothetical protein